MVYFFPPDERKKFLDNKNQFQKQELIADWDWQDELYFTLAPFFGWSCDWESFDNFPVWRLYKFIEKINLKTESLEDVLSIREAEGLRNIARIFGS